MEYFLVIFFHVAFGVLWAGGAITAGLFIVPAVLGAGPAGGQVMAGVVQRKFPMVMTVAGLVVVLSGLRLYMSRFTSAWVTSPEGIVLSVGALLGLGALFIGIFMQKPTAERLGALAAQIAQSGGPPSPEQASELQALRDKLGRVARVNAWHLVGATLCMALHRFATLL